MEISRTNPRNSLFWQVSGYLIAVSLLVLIGAGLYYFADTSADLPEALPRQIAFWSFMTWLALVWFCPLFILAWRGLARLNAREAITRC